MPACWQGQRRAPDCAGGFHAGPAGLGNFRAAAEPARLGAMAAAARTVGRLDAAERLADLVMKIAGIQAK